MPRQAIRVRGIVQGVGFRPYVYNLARRLGLHGFVQNQSGSVYIEVEGDEVGLAKFQNLLVAAPPPGALIDVILAHPRPLRQESDFTIRSSEEVGRREIVVSPDLRVCQDCLAELHDQRDRRYRYPLISCTRCGPRFTIASGAPYDRERTTYSQFDMCDDCRQEYTDPANRRFHAQTICCPACGPRVSLRDQGGDIVQVADPIIAIAAALREGQIVALKGIGGYHLVCDTRNEVAVAQLRMRKHRDEKPLAIMVRDLEAAETLCMVGSKERELLQSPQAPIVLLRRRNDCGRIARQIAPGNPYLGIMLPCTPLQHLLFAEVDPISLVMTSGNRSEEPIAIDDKDALDRLGMIADLFLTHDLPIHVRCDDSVSRVLAGRQSPVRRSRGYAPAPLKLPIPCQRPILAVGAQLKSTFALGSEFQAVISHHLGDLDDLAAHRAFENDIALYENLFEVRPDLIARDLHPDYASTRYALSREILTFAVQHHHAHLASCMAEHGITDPVIGVIFDGAGFGTDGALWGGEFMVGDYGGFRRVAHLRYVRMPGGEQAVREVWRMAAAYLLDAGSDSGILSSRVDRSAVRNIERMLARGLNSPFTSSMGRLFDAVAALAGVRTRAVYEGQAALELEWLATGQRECGSYTLEIERTEDAKWIIDPRPLIQEVARDVTQGVATPLVARRFHTSMVEMIAEVCNRVREAVGLSKVVFSGGVFMNALLTREAEARLSGTGFKVLRHERVPTNDGGLSLGQLVIAAHHLAAAK